MLTREELKTIPGVARAAHLFRFAAFQPKLAAAMVRDWRQRDRYDPPLPPVRLRYRVHGFLDPGSFLEVGRTVAADIRALLARIGREFESFGQVLDFGCGAGRVLRNFSPASAACRLHGTDIDPDLVGWCERHMPGIRWSVNPHLPPTAFGDDAFDLIYAISVFTHLDEAYQNAWLEELRRIARPGGILILTVHGESASRTLSAARQERLRARGFLYLREATGWLKLDGLPDFYQSAFHTQAYIRSEWGKHFEVLEYVERGINDHQDAVLLRKRSGG